MARQLRIELPGGVYHVTSRGNQKEPIFFSEDDRHAWLKLLAEVCAQSNWICYAYCQMDNHYHLIVETPEGNLSQGMRQLNGVYTQQINRIHQRVGHLFQGRYKAILVDKESYLLELARYVVLNPVRAGAVSDVCEWGWSSYLATVGREACPGWLKIDWLLSQFGSRRSQAQERYINFVRAGIGLDSVWDELRGQIYLGNETFVKKMQDQISDDSDLREIPRAQRRPLARPLAEYQWQYSNRRKAMAVAYGSGDYTLQQIADFFGVHYSTVSRAVKHFIKED
ncbi:REP-associated tyrosine transposase [Motiliproteus sp. MSK22-1]|uniref:REP-associated tyrosine transposase n=1 Tax=Motiliproteus sp. MSK22-1 TaxID=1897630 RepID=UPI0009772AF9|nr:transposase [Motiliproteus sp. MSK22-1]OMH30398.1 addiction module toxin RelE [Motiliproteus sp. MSK22-1]